MIYVFGEDIGICVGYMSMWRIYGYEDVMMM